MRFQAWPTKSAQNSSASTTPDPGKSELYVIYTKGLILVACQTGVLTPIHSPAAARPRAEAQGLLMTRVLIQGSVPSRLRGGERGGSALSRFACDPIIAEAARGGASPLGHPAPTLDARCCSFSLPPELGGLSSSLGSSPSPPAFPPLRDRATPRGDRLVPFAELLPASFKTPSLLRLRGVTAARRPDSSPLITWLPRRSLSQRRPSPRRVFSSLYHHRGPGSLPISFNQHEAA
ncbi:hypothetical protein AAFF_G00175370 [Aldrovandia affinis]|uniref:Uncharacterized protein n=1 Tax=Aldrovandia affinis TaxID=143900 RepID=A0AAD7W731_9TELE|nr:hypothetical protein AAFF_G00175370 [Aldrovandia affinis]